MFVQGLQNKPDFDIFLHVMCYQLLLQKEREDATASYKSTQAGQSKENNVPTAPSASSAQELASRENSPSSRMRMSALQALSAFAHPVTMESELPQRRSSPNSTPGFQRLPAAATSNVELIVPTNRVSLAFSRQMSDSAVSFAGAYRSYRDSEDATVHRSLDSSCPPAPKLKAAMPPYMAQHSFPGADGPGARSVPISSDNAFEMLSASLNEDSVNKQRCLEYKGAYGGISDEPIHNYGNVSGTVITHFVYHYPHRQ